MTRAADDCVSVSVLSQGVSGTLDASRECVSVLFCCEYERRELSADAYLEVSDGQPWRMVLTHAIQSAAGDMARQLWRLRHCGNRAVEVEAFAGLGDAVYALRSGGLAIAQLVGAGRDGDEGGPA